MYLLKADEMRELDRLAIEKLGIPGVVLMENAGLQATEIIYKMIGEPKGKKITIFTGKGNNGGDGFVVARHLINAGAEVQVLMLADIDNIQGDARINLNILQAMGYKSYFVGNPNSINIIKLALLNSDLIVDAIFGIGFRGDIPEYIGNIIEQINLSEKPVLAIDIPSGLNADSGIVKGPCIKATKTVTFSQTKLGLVVHNGPEFTGELTVADISIPISAVKSLTIKRYLVTPKIVKGIMPKRLADSHKGDYGRVLVVAGSKGMIGAAALCAQGALKAGAGLVTAAVPTSLQNVMAQKVTEIMTMPLTETDEGSISPQAIQELRGSLRGSQALALGPGLSMNQKTQTFVLEFIKRLDCQTVIDADGLNALQGNLECIKECPAPVILTPHPGEMARLLGIKTEEVQNNRVEVALEAARKGNCVVVLKGFRTIIASADGSIFVNPTGNPGMATGGSGDVLTGVISGLLASGLEPLEAAVAGTYIHGSAGDLASMNKGLISLTAGDIIDHLPLVTKEFA